PPGLSTTHPPPPRHWRTCHSESRPAEDPGRWLSRTPRDRSRPGQVRTMPYRPHGEAPAEKHSDAWAGRAAEDRGEQPHLAERHRLLRDAPFRPRPERLKNRRPLVLVVAPSATRRRPPARRSPLRRKVPKRAFRDVTWFRDDQPSRSLTRPTPPRPKPSRNRRRPPLRPHRPARKSELQPQPGPGAGGNGCDRPPI
ncbi:MAG: hypothetical protein RJB55_2463, partial [Verrucomicrobiota bacterium]